MTEWERQKHQRAMLLRRKLWVERAQELGGRHQRPFLFKASPTTVGLIANYMRATWPKEFER